MSGIWHWMILPGLILVDKLKENVMSTEMYYPPEDIFEAAADLHFDEALDNTDPRYVDTLNARGNFKMREFYRLLHINTSKEPFTLAKRLPASSYTLFCGHIGCGKSTELRHAKKILHRPTLFYVIFLDIVKELDPNNLNYADVLLALAKQLFQALEQEKIHIDPILLANLENWFKERIESHEKTKELAAEIRSEGRFGAGVPFLTYLFTSMTSFMLSNSKYKQEIRNVIVNSFSQFADAFNQCVLAAEEAIYKAGKGQRLLFIVDGTDRLRGEDGERFFIKDVHQLTQIDGHFIYCSPIHLSYKTMDIYRSFNVVILPMIKLHDRDKRPLPHNQNVMRDMLFKRFPPQFFTEPNDLADQLVDYSGGCPRELIRLLKYAYLEMDGEQLDSQAVEKGINRLAVDYKRILETGDYALLAEIDQPHQAEKNSERIQHFLLNMIVLEYNNYWREPHPAIRRLPAFQEALTHVV